MNKPEGRNVLFTLTSYCLSRQNKRSSFHSKAHFIQQLQDCGDFKSLTATHSNVLKSGFLDDTFTTNHLINGYARLQKSNDAHHLFDEMSEPNVVSWTSLMAGFVDTGRPKMALWLFTKMPRRSVMPNVFTFATVVNACSILADLRTGKKLHAQVETFGFQSNLVVCSSLIDMYGKSNEVEEALRVFNSMSCRNIVSWTSMVAVLGQNAQGDNALQLFRQFNHSVLDAPNHFMLASAISACASLGRLVSGKVTHGVVIRRGHDLNHVVSSALVDMYAKCGSISYCNKVFQMIPNPSVIPYTSMIVGAAKHGLGAFSLYLFKEMLRKRIKPNDVTFVGVLYACSHSGLVDEGLKHLNLMYKEHGIMPDAKHYTCVVDMLSRSGRLNEAYQLAKSVEVLKPDEGALLWGTLLSASRLHGRVDIAVEASKWLIESNQQVAAAYVTLSNTYALAGKWENVYGIRSEMKHKGVHKEPGCSWVENKDSSYVFYAGDVSSCPRGSEVLSLLRELERRMKERGYVGGSVGLVFVEVEEEANEEIVGLHSERLALGFALLSMPKGMTIRVMKNLRMCRDCHEAFKLISHIMERDIVVRDVNRFHHFKNGCCTCNDFW
ncbi:pentatricopeptide repeat-containing protein At4g15720 [Malania oleifera]|uniref:pentatricopeptide repeat-containing protein At4g15720 n=1 Tax=Malania oleifera TaxID=397392 RepID=UPI0025ADD46B|nr:pentatricopeptide repeat-containing protein At4g15720 [Malania oleifera]